MSKLGLIIKREYISRVKKRSFLLATFLTPLGILLYILVIGAIFSYQSDDLKSVLVSDPYDVLVEALPNSSSIEFTVSDEPLSSLRKSLNDTDYDGIVYLDKPDLSKDKYEVKYYSDNDLDLAQSSALESAVRKRVEDYKIKALNLDRNTIDQIKSRVSVDPEPLIEGEKDRSSMRAAVGTGLGMAIGFILFFMVFMYGMMVMRGVMEEKTSRIIEVLASTVKPIHLMMGKVIGVGLVALTQLAIWAVTIPLVYLIGQLIMGTPDPSSISGMNAEEMQAMAQNTGAFDKISEVVTVLGDLNWFIMVPMILIYVVGGYLLYASVYAALGSAIGEDLGEAQSLTAPVSIPIVIGFYVMFMAAQAPHSSLAVIFSMIPLTSPLVMPARLPFEVPFWQLLISVALLAVTIYGMIWLSARIYRTGILMYGKKATFKEIWKWIRA